MSKRRLEKKKFKQNVETIKNSLGELRTPAKGPDDKIPVYSYPETNDRVWTSKSLVVFWGFPALSPSRIPERPPYHHPQISSAPFA